MKTGNKSGGRDELAVWCNHVLRMIDAGEVKFSREAVLRKSKPTNKE